MNSVHTENDQCVSGQCVYTVCLYRSVGVQREKEMRCPAGQRGPSTGRPGQHRAGFRNSSRPSIFQRGDLYPFHRSLRQTLYMSSFPAVCGRVSKPGVLSTQGMQSCIAWDVRGSISEYIDDTAAGGDVSQRKCV